MELKKGQKLPDWRLSTVGGTSRAFHDALGAPALYVAWASWDASRAAIPAVEAFHREHGARVRVASVAFDVEGPGAAMRVLRHAGATHDLLIDSCFVLSRVWGVRSLPFGALADAEGYALLVGAADEAFFAQAKSALKRKPERREAKRAAKPGRDTRVEILLQACANFLGRKRLDDALKALSDAQALDPSNPLITRQRDALAAAAR
jgi:hypothetical protein